MIFIIYEEKGSLSLSEDYIRQHFISESTKQLSRFGQQEITFEHLVKDETDSEIHRNFRGLCD